jgi:hypothetical protein
MQAVLLGDGFNVWKNMYLETPLEGKLNMPDQLIFKRSPHKTST